jgi:hypothetical protein
MPRKPAKLKRQKHKVCPALINYFKTGNENQEDFPKHERFNNFLPHFPTAQGPNIEDYWRMCRDDLLRDWIKENPCSRPWFWWQHDAPEEREEAPLYEAAYLERHGLLRSSEKKYLTDHPELKEPERVL